MTCLPSERKERCQGHLCSTKVVPGKEGHSVCCSEKTISNQEDGGHCNMRVHSQQGAPYILPSFLRGYFKPPQMSLQLALLPVPSCLRQVGQTLLHSQELLISPYCPILPFSLLPLALSLEMYHLTTSMLLKVFPITSTPEERNSLLYYPKQLPPPKPHPCSESVINSHVFIFHPTLTYLLHNHSFIFHLALYYLSYNQVS